MMESSSTDLAQSRQASLSRPRPLVGRTTKRIYDEVREAALKVDGSMALGAHAMHSVLRLDAHRQSLSQGDPVTSALLSEIEAAAIQQVKAIQANLFNVWNV